MTLKAVFLEFQGTVLHDAHLREQLTEDCLLQENLNPNAQDYQHCCVGRRDRACLKDLLQQRGRFVNEQRLTELVAQQQEAYSEAINALEELPLYPGIDTFIRKLQAANLRVGLLSLLSAAVLEPLLIRANLAESFDVKVTADGDWSSPPEPAGYELLLQRLGDRHPEAQITAHNCLAIDHTLPGIAAAQQAGIQVVGITHTYPLHILQRHTRWAVDKFSELELERIEADFAERNSEPSE